MTVTLRDMPKAHGISDRRISRGWSQDQLATISGVDVRTIQRAEKGEGLTLNTLQALASAFDCSVDDLIAKKKNEGTKKPNTSEPKIHLIPRLTSGKQIMDVVGGADAFHFDHDELKSAEEAEGISTFIQSIKDWAEIWSDIEAGDRVKASFDCNDLLKAVETIGFAIFGFQRKVFLRTEQSSDKSVKFHIGTIVVKRADDPKIVRTGDMEVLPSIFEENQSVKFV